MSEFQKLVGEAKAKIREVSVDQVWQKIQNSENFNLIDVREEGEWATGHAKGALHIGKGVIERDIEKAVPDKSAEIVLYCGGGSRSALAAESVQKMGYRSVYSMDGGMGAWRKAGLPEES